MTENNVIETIKDHIDRQFPKECRNCGRRFESLQDYLRITTPVGQPISHDADVEDWQPKVPLGTFAMANCTCGGTMQVDSEGMNLLLLWRLLRWTRKESKRRGISFSELLDHLRDEIRVSALVDHE